MAIYPVLPITISSLNDPTKIAGSDMVPIIAGLSGLSQSTIDEMDMVDVVGVAEKLQTFLDKTIGSLEIGKK